VLNLPAIAEEADPLGRAVGEALWPEKYPLHELEALREDDPHVFQSQYQGNPVPVSGAIFSRSRFRYARDGGAYFELLGPLGATKRVLKPSCLWFLVADMATRTNQRNDYTAVMVPCVTPDGDMIVVDVVAERWQLGEQWPRVRAIAAAHPHVAFLAAALRGAGHGLVAAAASDGVAVRVLKEDTDKGIRAMPAAVAYEGGRIYHMEGAPWLAAFEEQLVLFPSGRHDDMVDCLAHAWNQTQTEGVEAVMCTMDPDGTTRTSWDRPADPSPAPVAPPEPDEPAVLAVVGPSPRGHADEVRARRGRRRWFQ